MENQVMDMISDRIPFGVPPGISALNNEPVYSYIIIKHFHYCQYRDKVSFCGWV